MPGILPMKVIKVGSSAQSRIAQACDRCRSKKIRCDGVRPCCSQCASVGFECKTSDKLSRRAFPRGYTESLEDRVRALESEVRDLKNLLDEKDEKIEVLSRLQSFSSASKKQQSASAPATEQQRPSATDSTDGRGGRIQIQLSQTTSKKSSAKEPFCGPSSTRAFIGAFKRKFEECGRSPVDFSTDALLSASPVTASREVDSAPLTVGRLVSDQLINIYFQEWAPLYPVVHRPSILKAYGQYLNDLDSLQHDRHAMTQLNLIFGIAALSSRPRTNQDPTIFERTWYPALTGLVDDVSLSTLQCYVLAQVYCSTKGDYKSLSRYRGLAVSLCHQLGLQQSQAEVEQNVLIKETGKKVFWCQYVLDRFSSALTGSPMLLNESDITSEYPQDVDDENVTETGFLPTLPGESTRLSSALALFDASRILSKTLEDVFLPANSQGVAISKIQSLAEELDAWRRSLPQHLRLEFSQDKPSTNVTSSRAPLLSMAYYFIRSLIHRPVACFAQPNLASASVLSLADSSKHIIQILQLLDERRMSHSISVNRKELVVAAGMGLMWQNLGLKKDCKLAKEGQKLLLSVIELLELESPPAASEFVVITSPSMPVDGVQRDGPAGAPGRDESVSPRSRSLDKRFQSLKSRLPVTSVPERAEKPGEMSRRNTVSNASPPALDGHLHPQSTQHGDDSRAGRCRSIDVPTAFPNLDYFPFVEGSDNQAAAKQSLTMADWENVLGNMDNGRLNIFNGIYGGSGCGDDSDLLSFIANPHGPPHAEAPLSQSLPVHSATHLNDGKAWSPGDWSSSSSHELPNHTGVGTGAPVNAAQSVVSFSEESLGSAEELHGSHHDDKAFTDPFDGILIPSVDELEFQIDGFNYRSCAV